MNKIITKKVKYRGKEISVDDLKEQSQIKIIVECKHGQREVRWNRRNQLCKKCSIEIGVFNTCKKGRVITWGHKISEAKKGKEFTDKHKEALLEARAKKICDKKGIDIANFQGFPTKKEQFKLRTWTMAIFNKSAKKVSVDEQDKIMIDTLNYTANDLKQHLESQFQDNMSWDNYGEWHIDHVKPESWFTYSSIHDDDFKRCWSLDNLQPMWAWQNIDKSNKYEGTHRPRKIYILAGQFGAGKTTLCEELKEKFTVISYDDINVKQLDSFIANNYYNDKPIILDLPTNISTIYRRYADKGYDIHLVALVESKDIIRERLLKRGGKINDKTIDKRYNRIQSITKNYASYSGNYAEVLNYLNNLKI